MFNPRPAQAGSAPRETTGTKRTDPARRSRRTARRGHRSLCVDIEPLGPLGRWGRPLRWHPRPCGLGSLSSFCLSSQTQLPACASARGASRLPRIHVLGRGWEPPCSCPRENTLFPPRRKRPSGGSGHTGRRRLSGQRARGCSTQPTAGSSRLRPPPRPAGGRGHQLFLLLLSVPGGPQLSGNQGHRGLSTWAHPTRPHRPGEAAAAGPGSPSRWRSGPPGPGGLTCTQN